MKRPEQFVITLKNERIKNYIRLGYILTAINLIPFVLFLFFSDAWFAGVVGLASTLIYFVIRWLMVRKRIARYFIDENIFFVLAAVWLLQSDLMAVLILLTGILFKITIQPLSFVFSKSSIKKNFFPKKEYPWPEVENAILKDGILTINFKNNKLIQAPAEDLTKEEIIAFNEFVNERLSP